ncbi:MFS transporter [Phytomonospora endophytica]|uniref:MFS family permease n=1 Tax=Phytomonospora endophytica TaxID=714109 RepID=A0A841G1P2_9ACTN|nr:MFS transporter [Phytomonospora endophytica]MBB6038599.1 MFS family permease [Phytomonospora endophytica]GIG69258.1 hypothetical protein Pen01_55530 [Phytomonospora endophytica]
MSLTAAVAAPAVARASRAERLILPATFITFLGNNIQLSASALLVVRTEHTAMAVTWLFVAAAIPQVLLSVPAGRLADRFDRRRLLIACDLLSAAFAAALPLWLLAGGEPGRAAYLVNLALAATGALFIPAGNAFVKERVGATRLGRFSARYEMVSSAGSLLSVAAGGVLVGWLGPLPVFAFNAVTFLASAVCWFAAGEGKARPAGESATAEPARAVGRGVLRAGALYVIGSATIVVSNTLIVMLVIEQFRRGAAVLGFVDALAGTGMLLAGVLSGRCVARLGDARLTRWALVVLAVVCALQPSIGPAGMLLFLPGGLTYGLARISMRTMLMEAAPADRAGRIFGVVNALGLLASIVVGLLVALLCDGLAIRYGFWVISAVLLAGAVIAVPRRR